MGIVGDGQEESDISKSADEAQIEASADLVLDLRLMVNNPAFSDVVFVCKDGERVQALRLLLTGRSHVLQSMLMNGMAESNSSEIKSSETSAVLLSVFEFLYTGTLLDYPPQNWRMSCEVLIASQFFLLPKLERIIRKFMHAQTVSVVTDLSKAAYMLTEAVEFKALCEKTDVNLKELVSVLSSDWSDPYFVQGLSEDALHYLLANSKGSCEDDNKFTFEQYLRFREVIRWRVYQRPHDPYPEEEEDMNSFVNIVVPDEKRALSLCVNFESRERFKSLSSDASLPSDAARPSDVALPSDVWTSFLYQYGGEELRQAVLRLMSHIDCRRIHPILLVKVVEPMKIISAEQIMSSLSFHALRRPMIFKGLESRWEHGESYRVQEQGKRIERSGNKIGLAVATVPMSRPYGVYEWRFILEEACNGFAEFGFIRFGDGVPEAKGKLDGERLSDLDHARALCYTGLNACINWRGSRRIDWRALNFIQPGAIVFNYNASEHCCSLSLYGMTHGAIWTRLPSGTYYPAVCLGNCSNGRVRLELVSGFDIL